MNIREIGITARALVFLFIKIIKHTPRWRFTTQKQGNIHVHAVINKQPTMCVVSCFVMSQCNNIHVGVYKHLLFVQELQAHNL